MGNLLVLPFGIEDRFGTNIANYDVKFDIGFLDLPSQIAAMVTGLMYHMLLMPLAGLGLLAMKWVTQPDALLTVLSDLYRKLVDPIFEIVSFPLLAILAVGILFLYISIDTVRYTSSFRQDAERMIVGTALALVAVVLARDPFGPVAFMLRSIREIVRDITRGDSLPATTVDSFLAPITQTLSYGAPLNSACAAEWSEAMSRPGMTPTCVQALDTVGFGAPAAVLLAVTTATAMLVYAALAVFRMAIHLFGGTWRVAVIPYAVLATIVQRRKYATISNLLGMAAAHYVMVLVVLLISLIGPPLFTAFMVEIVTDGNEPAGTGRLILGMIVMALGYGVMTYVLNKISHSSGALARSLRLSGQRSLDAHLGAPGTSAFSSLSLMGDGQKDDLAEKQVSAVSKGAKALLGAASTKVLGDSVVEDWLNGSGSGSDNGDGEGKGKAGSGVTQDEAVASPFASALAPDFIVLDENGQFQTKQGFAVGDTAAKLASMAGASSGTASAVGAVAGALGAMFGGRKATGSDDDAEPAAPIYERDANGAVILPEGNPEDRSYFRHRQFSALASGLMVPSGMNGSAVHGRTPPPVEDVFSGLDGETGETGDEGRTESLDEGTDLPGSGVSDPAPVDPEAGDMPVDDADYGFTGEQRQMPEDEFPEDLNAGDDLAGNAGAEQQGWDYGYQEPSPEMGTDHFEQETEDNSGRHRASAEEDAAPTPPVAPGIVGGGSVPPAAEVAPTPDPVVDNGHAAPAPTPAPAETASTETQRRENYPVLGMTTVGADMEFLSTGEVPDAPKPAAKEAPASGLLGSVTTEYRVDDYVETSVSSVPDATFVAGREAAITDSRVISAAMGHGDITAVPLDDPSMSLTFEINADGENVVSPKHDFGF